jgi:hypothetical protein
MSYREREYEDYLARRDRGLALRRMYGGPAPRRPKYRTHRKTGKHYPVHEKSTQIEVLNRRFASPYDIESVTRDGRKFNIRIMALSQDEAIDQAMKKFPLITITKIRKGKIGGSGHDLRGKAGTTGRALKTLGRTAERLARFIDTESEEEKRYAREEEKKPREDRAESIL